MTPALTNEVKNMLDELGQISAEMADLAQRRKTITDKLDRLPKGSYEGHLFRINAIDSERNTLDMKAVRAKLSPQFIRAHTKTTKVRSYKVVGRIGTDQGGAIDAVAEAALEAEGCNA